MIAYLVTRLKVTVATLAAAIAPTYPRVALTAGGDRLCVDTHDEGGRDYVDMQEMTIQEALLQWQLDSPTARELFDNPSLNSPTRPFYANLINDRRPNRLFPRLVRCLMDAGIDSVVVGQYGLHMPAEDFLRRCEQEPAWEWDHETTPEYR